MVSLQSAPARTVAVALGVATFLVMTVVRFLWEVTGEWLYFDSLGLSASNLVFRLVVLATLVAVGWRALAGRGWRDAALVLTGPLGGLGAFLVVHWAVFGPSGDSPTWLIYLVFCGSIAVAGGVVYVLGRGVRRLGSRKLLA